MSEPWRGKKWRPIMVLATDGAHVPTQPERAKWEGEWEEAKGFRFRIMKS